MSADLITTLEAEQVRLRGQIAAVEACLAALKGTTGAPSGRTTTASHARGRKADRRGRSVPRPRPAPGRVSHATSDNGIVDAIRDGHVTKSSLKDATKLPVYNLESGLKRLIAAGRVVATGATNNRKFALAGAKPAGDKSFLGIA